MTTNRTPAALSTRKRFRTVEVGVWDDPGFLGLSAPAKLLWLYLLTGPQTTVFPGLFFLSLSEVSERFGWTHRQSVTFFARIRAAGMANYDPLTRVCFLPNAVRKNPPPNPNVVRAWVKALAELPACPLRDVANGSLNRLLHNESNGFGNGFRVAYAEEFAKRFGGVFRKQDQDQDQITPLPPEPGGRRPSAGVESESRPARTANDVDLLFERVNGSIPLGGEEWHG